MPTRKRIDKHSTELGLWLREQKELDEELGYVYENLDYIGYQYLEGKVMLLEEKRLGVIRDLPQRVAHSIVDQAMLFALRHMDFSPYVEAKRFLGKLVYYGYYVIRFENTSPDDGGITLFRPSENKVWQVTREQFLRFLQFDMTVLNEIRDN